MRPKLEMLLGGALLALAMGLAGCLAEPAEDEDADEAVAEGHAALTDEPVVTTTPRTVVAPRDQSTGVVGAILGQVSGGDGQSDPQPNPWKPNASAPAPNPGDPGPTAK